MMTSGKSSGPTPPNPTRSEWTDEALFAACGAGDDMAFRILVDRHVRLVRRLALNVLGDEHDAEDVAQETFVAAWRARASWTPDARFSTWLHRIAVNKAIDRYRRRRATPQPAEVLTRLIDADDARPASEDQHDALERVQTARSLKAALGRLPGAQRQALTLFYFEDLDVARIAATMGLSEQAVRSLLKRGRGTLKARLQRQKKICDNGTLALQGPARDPRA